MSAFARRLIALVATLLILTVLVFVLLDLLPGDPAGAMLGTSASPEALAALRHDLGLDQPAPVRYAVWLGGMLRGDFGTSITYGVPVAALIGERLAVTLPLTAMALALACSIGLPLGTLAGASRGASDRVAAVFVQFGIAVPNFWIGLLLILGVSLRLGWLPAGGFPGWHAGLVAGLQALILPAVALALPQAAVLTRVVRAAVRDTAGADFVRTARAKGLGRAQILSRHVFPNAMIPALTILGLQASFLIAGAVLVENVFTLPGLGRLAWQALNQRDLTVMRAVVLFFAVEVVLVNWSIDGLYRVVDPRLSEPA